MATKQTIVRKLDTIYKLKTFERDGYRCQKCQHRRLPKNLEPHHHVKRGKYAARWCLNNLITLCKWDCHIWAENHPVLWREWFLEHYPDRYAEAEYLKRHGRHIRVSDMDILLGEVQ